MKRLFALMLCVLISFVGCTAMTPSTSIEMELTDHYDTSDIFVNEKLFYVSESIDTLKLNISFQMEGESGILEIADNETKQAIWSEEWSGNVDKNTFTITLDAIEKEKEYVLKFTGTKIKYTKITITSKDNLIKEREKPLKPNKK